MRGNHLKSGAWLGVGSKLLNKQKIMGRKIIGLDAAVIKQVIDGSSDRTADFRTTIEASRWIGETPSPARRSGKKCVFYLLLFCERQCPRILAADNSFKRGIVTTPGQSEVTSVIVEETLIAKSSMVWIRLVEDISVTTGCTFNDCVLQVGAFAHGGFYRLDLMAAGAR